MTSVQFEGPNSGFQTGNNYGSIQYTVEQSSNPRDDRVRKFLSLLNTCPYEDRKNRNNRRVPGTCEWFTTHPKFTNWQQSTSHDLAGLLWVSADPGCGKSVLTRYLVDEVLCNEKQTVCYFFFKDDFPDQRNAAGALSAILHQIFVARPKLLSDTVLKKLETDGEKLIQSFHKLWDILMFVSVQEEEESKGIVCILDALDECRDRDELIEAVTMFYQRLHESRKLKFLMTSRPYPHIERLIWNLRTKLPTIHLSGDDEEEVQKISREIGLVISKRVSDIGKQRSLEEDERNLLEQQLTAVENRTYLWVSLTLDVLENMPGFTKGNIRRVIQHLPTTVESAYGRILDRSSDKMKAKVLLHIITAAVRPFSLEELSLAWAIHINLDSTTLTAISDDLEPKERFRETLRDLCGLFVVVIDEKIYLLHQTAKEFLVQSDKSTVNQISHITEWKCALIPEESNDILASICISWLPWITDAQSNIERGEFDGYSSCHWITHYHQANVQDGNVLIMRAQSVCDPSSDVYPVWSKLYEAEENYIPRSTSRLLIASFLGLTGVVKLLLATGNVNINSKGSDSRAALSWKKPVMKLLLGTKKMEMNSRDSEQGLTPLSWAARNGHEAVVKLLLETKTDINIKDSRGRTPLSWAARDGHEAVVKLLLQTKKMDINSKDSGGRTPLSLAAWNSHEAVVKLLLETKKMDINTKDSDGWTPLFYAVFNSHEAVVKLLLETKKVDINSKDSGGRTPLSLAAWNGHEAVVKLLLETKKMDINTKDSGGWTPLFFAAVSGHKAVVKLLLETNTDINIKDLRGQTPLSFAAWNGHEAVVKLLLETKKMDINIKDSEGRTPLSLAAEDGHEAVVKLLLETEMEINSKDRFGQTPLSIAAGIGHEAVVKLLLETKKVDINTKNSEGRTPLSLAAEDGHEAVVKLLQNY
ncbi:ankyrin repeat domain-containing protein 50 [Aspergillus awamori]|uniref:Ankyrin repeat domain-containing protein 50 n=1 Tax=Aspergillus awamori TaxID=105351 RepID=A0A401KP78_ASPAW|nr:ankyrin repeat domain-containing protein 50 [Aspergillus awamori]